MQLVILAGGKGTRLGLTDIPKPMCPIAGKPLLERQIELAKTYGFDEIFILSGHLAHVISDYFGDGSRWGVKIHHIVEDKPLGTAGALKLIENKLAENFMVIYGDVVMDFDMQAMLAFANRMPAVATLLVHPNNHPYDSDLLQIDSRGRVTALLPKPHPDGLIYHNLVNAAVYVFNKKILSYIAADTAQDFGKDIFPRLLQAGETLRAYHSAEYVKDMGTKDRLPVICADVESGKVSRLNKKNARPAVFLDRDGVLNRDMDKAPRAENFELLPGVSEAVRLLNQSDYLSIVVTNQPMIAKGFVTFHDVDEVHKRLETELGNEKAYLDGIYFCPHHPEKGFPGEVAELKIDCGCRKPKPGKENLLGVEGIDAQTLYTLLQNAGVSVQKEAAGENVRRITKLDFFEDGLSGGADAANKRALLLKRLGLPSYLTANALLEVINSMMTYEEYQTFIKQL